MKDKLFDTPLGKWLIEHHAHEPMRLHEDGKIVRFFVLSGGAMLCVRSCKSIRSKNYTHDVFLGAREIRWDAAIAEIERWLDGPADHGAADPRLAAAAPRLLAELKALLEFAETYGVHGGAGVCDWEGYFASAREAITQTES